MTQVTEPTTRVSARGDAWRAVPVQHDRIIGRVRHIVGADQLTAACGARVTANWQWVGNRNKPKCGDCLRLAPDPDQTAELPGRTAAQREADREAVLRRAEAARKRHEDEGRRDEPTRTRPPEKPEWDLRYGFGYPELPVTEAREWAGWKDSKREAHTNPHVILAALERDLGWADQRMSHAMREVENAREKRDGLRAQVMEARRNAGLCAGCGDKTCTCKREKKG